MDVNLDNRIAAAFTANLDSEQLGTLLSEIQEAAAATATARIEAEAAALDPATTSDSVAAARKAMEDADFRTRRLAAAREKLSQLRQRTVAQERKHEHELEHAAAIAERDKLAADLAAEYPKAAATIAGLLARLRESDQRIAAANLRGVGPWIRGAEGVARNAPENWEVSGGNGRLKPLSGVRLPRLLQNPEDAHGSLWPRFDNQGIQL